ncbi:MAG TPA: hypothetical protein VF871_03525 [Burkholderiales bacterium]
MRFRLLTTASLLALAGCHLHSDPPGEAPSGVVVTPGEGLVTVNWNRDPELTYWIFYQPGSSVAPAAPGVPLIFDAVPPRVVAGLANDTQYAFIMNATRDDSKAGPSSPIVVKTPRLAGAEWASGTALGTNLNGIAFNGSRLVVVGDSGTIFAGDYNYTSTDPLGVTAWMPATLLPVGFSATTNLSAVIFSGQQFVALGIDGSILTSTDGLTWTLATGSIPSASMNGIAFGTVSGAGLYVAVDASGSIFTSSDLVNWNLITPPITTRALYSVSFLNGRFMATGANGTLLTSADGSIWTAQTSNTTNALRGAAFRSAPTAVYVVVGDAGTIVTSTDGTAWNPIPITPPLPQNLNSVVFGSRFIAVGQSGAVVFSDDGSTWSPPTTPPDRVDLARVVFTPAMYVAVGAAGANAFAK